MNTKILSQHALSVIDQYLNFTVGGSTCSVPYFNNKTTRSRAALRTFIGKGSPKDIHDEVLALLIKDHIPPESLGTESLKKLLTDKNIGVDCSAFAYYVLNAENKERGHNSLDKHLNLIHCAGILGKIRGALRPVENTDVQTFANNKNSGVIPLKDVQVGDMITMLEDGEESEHDHILVIHQIEYQNFIPTTIHYSHAVAYPEDGVYGTGIKQGTITIVDIQKPITQQQWSEYGKTGNENRIFVRAQKSKTDICRLLWW
jgi:hypothetical protein